MYVDKSHRTGAMAESAVVQKLITRGIVVSMPMYVNAPYDIIADNGRELYKVQIKAGRWRNGRFVVDLRQKTADGTSTYDAADVDVFALYDPDFNTVYWVPFDEAPSVKLERKSMIQYETILL